MRKLIITDIAKSNIKNLLDYLEINWNIKIREKFSDDLYKCMKLSQKSPEIFPVSDYNKRIRKCVISKQSTLYYTFNQNLVVILAVFDTRQNPTKINKIK